MLLESNPLLNKIRYYAGFLMVVIYLIVGLLFIFSDIAIDTFPGYRKPIGVVLLIYAAFRLYSTIRKI